MERISHYEIERRLGRGGMGEVVAARDLKLRRTVALKFLSPDLAGDRAALTRFEREALAAAELNHPHIATVYAFEPEGERPFIAMELLAGPSLRERLDQGPLAVAEALVIARDVAAALAYAHRRGTSHRDVKPENLMFDEHRSIKVMDFGLARATMASKLTMTGTSLGTPAYMSPEALRGETGPAGDVFALGLVLWESIAGRRAFPGDNVMAIMFAIANEDPPPLSSIVGGVAPEVDALLSRMLAKDPAARLDAAGAARELAVLTGAPARGMPESDAPLRPAGDAAASAGRSTRSTAATVAMPVRSTADTLALTAPERPRSAAVPATALTEIREVDRPPATKRTSSRMLVIAALVLVVAGASGFLVVQARARQRAQASALAELGAEAFRTHRLDDARGLFAQALAIDPRQQSALNNLGLFALRDSNLTRAESLFTIALEVNHKDPALRSATLYNLAEVDIARGVPGRAVSRLREAASLDSSNVEVVNNLAWALTANGQPAEALTVLNRALSSFGEEKHLLKNAGLAAEKMGRRDEALIYFERALMVDPAYEEADSLHERVLRAQGGRP